MADIGLPAFVWRTIRTSALCKMRFRGHRSNGEKGSACSRTTATMCCSSMQYAVGGHRRFASRHRPRRCGNETQRQVLKLARPFIVKDMRCSTCLLRPFTMQSSSHHNGTRCRRRCSAERYRLVSFLGRDHHHVDGVSCSSIRRSLPVRRFMRTLIRIGFDICIDQGNCGHKWQLQRKTDRVPWSRNSS
jgi:hypothetical protein